MKNLLALVTGLMIVSTPALASRARLEALGEGKNGSYYIKDNRNVFLNPASIADNKKQFNIELGSDSNAQDTKAAPVGQANYIGTFGDYSYLVSFGNESDAAKKLISNASASFLAPDRHIELGVAGGSDLKYGLSLIYGGQEQKASGVSKTASQLAARFGVGMNSFNFFGTVGIITKAVGGAAALDEFKGKLGLDLGATYAMDEMTFFVNFLTQSADRLSDTGTKAEKDREFSTMNISAGVGHQKELTKGANMFSKVGLSYGNTEVKTGTPGGTLTTASKDKSWSVPVTLGVEADATSWLALRGSITHNLLGQNMNSLNGNRDSNPNSTTIATGAGFKFGAVGIDASVATGTGTFGFDANMLSRLSMNVAF